MGELGNFPVDDATLLAVEHGLQGSYTIDDDGKHVLVGADYSLNELLDFMAGTMGEDPNAVLLSNEENRLAGIDAGWEIWEDTRIHYTRDDIIRALIAEVRRLRDGQGPQAATPQE